MPTAPQPQADSVRERPVRGGCARTGPAEAGAVSRVAVISRNSLLGGQVLGQGRDHRLAVDAHRLFLVVVLQIARELGDADVAQLLQLGDVLFGRAEDAEAIDDLVGY